MPPADTNHSMRNPVPFYGSYASFLRAIKALKEKGIPRKITGRTLAPLLGDEATRTAAHFGVMGWSDETGSPTQELRTLVAAFEGPKWKETLTAELERFYWFVPKPWEEITKATLHKAFVDWTKRDDEARILVSAETFFLALAYECGTNFDDTLWKRANRAHLEAKRPKDDEDEEQIISSLPTFDAGLIGKHIINEPTVSVPASPPEKVPQQAGLRLVDQILVTLSSMLGDESLAQRERDAIRITMGLLIRNMNAA